MNNKISGYLVPCCLQCRLREYERFADNCQRYIGVEGAAVINAEDHKLLGVATWGASSSRMLPVGFSVPNSINFWSNYKCALLIKNQKETNVDLIKFGDFQKLCDELIQ